MGPGCGAPPARRRSLPEEKGSATRRTIPVPAPRPPAKKRLDQSPRGSRYPSATAGCIRHYCTDGDPGALPVPGTTSRWLSCRCSSCRRTPCVTCVTSVSDRGAAQRVGPAAPRPSLLTRTGVAVAFSGSPLSSLSTPRKSTPPRSPGRAARAPPAALSQPCNTPLRPRRAFHAPAPSGRGNSGGTRLATPETAPDTPPQVRARRESFP